MTTDYERFYDDTVEARRQDREYVSTFIRAHDIALSLVRRDNYRPLREPGNHPLFGTLTKGITDGISCYCETCRGDLVHTSLGQHDLPEKPFQPYMSRARKGADKKEKARKPDKVNITELF